MAPDESDGQMANKTVGELHPDHPQHPRSVRRRLVIVVAALVAVAVVVGVVLPLIATANPAFFERYKSLKPRYAAWLKSKHRTVACSECHAGNRSTIGYRFSLVGEFYRGLFGATAKLPALVKMERPTRRACLKCHSDDWAIDSGRLMQVPHPAHVRVSDEKRDCVTCHKWTPHVETYASKHKKMPFTGICTSYGCHSGTKPMSECRFCHHTQKKGTAPWRTQHPKVVQSRGAHSCLDYCHSSRQCRTCHQTGKSPDMGTKSLSSSVRSIAALHAEGSWLKVHGPKAQEDVQRCYYCHGSGAECKECHSRRPAFHGPKASWLGLHQKVGKDKPRCLACHIEKDCNDCHKIFKEGR